MSLHQSLHQAHFSKNSIKFKHQKKRILPPTCDTVIKNLINSPLQHLGLINPKNVTQLFKDSNDLSYKKDLKLKKLGSQLTEHFSVEINQTIHVSQPAQLIDFLNEIDSLSVNIDGSYTMQPIVVESDPASNNTEYTLLIGQQRITSIYMTLKFLENNTHRLNTCKSSTDLLNNHFLGVINYEDWDSFLNNTQINDSFLNDNLSKSYQTLHNWFSKKSAVEHEIWKKKLLNHTKFIWYITDNEPFESEKAQKTGGVGIEYKYLS